MKLIKSIDTDAYNFMRVVNPYDTVKNPYAIDNLVKNIKAIPGGWQPNRVFYPFYGGTADSCKFNLFNPALYQLSYTGVPTFGNTGMLGSDTSGAATSFIPADAGMSLYGSMYGVSRHTKAPDGANKYLYNSGSGLLMYPVGGDYTALNFRTHSDSNAIIGGTNTVGISIINRSAINLLTVLHNDSTYTYTTTVASPYVPTKAIGITLFMRHRINCFLAMDYVDRQLMSDAIKQFNTELGRAV